MEERDDEPPPFWLQATTTGGQVDRHHHHQHHRRASSFFLSTGALVVFLLVSAIVFLSIVIPSVVSLSRQVFNPSLVKTSWTSLNVILVIFAIICGFLSRKDDDHSPVNTPTKKDDESLDKLSFNDFGDLKTIPRLRRSNSSYPNLRQESSLMIKENNRRFYDDTHVDNRQFQNFDRQMSHSRSFRQIDGDRDQIEARDIHEDESIIKNIVHENIVSPPKQPLISPSSQPPPMNIFSPPKPYFSPSPPQPPPPRRRHSSTTPNKKKTIQTFETIGYERYKWKDNSQVIRQPYSKSKVKLTPQPYSKSKVKLTPPPPPPPPPPPLPRLVVPAYYTQNKNVNNDRKRGNVSATKDFFTSFYHQSKRKHKRKSYEHLDHLIKPPKTTTIHRSKSTPEFPPSPPPPPPPPPPPSVIHTLFSKKVKTKVKPSTQKIPTNKNNIFTSMESFQDDKNIAWGNYSNESHFRPIPPPPPPPPQFKTKPREFIPKGNYGFYNYSSSSEDDVRSSTSSMLFRPSPDVNIKADDFIAKFRAKLNLEKSDSINLKQGLL